jgi:hypothetical protein
MNAYFSMSRAERVAPWVVGALFALPVLVAKYPPMADLPMHEASVGLLQHWGDTRFAPPTIYALNFGHANQLFSFLVLGLAYIVPISWACKLVVAGALLALPLAAARFADHMGAPRWTALVVAPIGLGWLFFWGLVQNILGLVALLTVLPAIDRFASQPTWRGVAKMCGVMVLLHFAHQAMQLVACGALVLCTMGAPLRWKPMAFRATPAVFCLLLAYTANRYSWTMAGPRQLRTRAFVFYDFMHKVVSLPGVLFGGYEPYVRNLMMALAIMPVILLAVDRARLPRAPPPALSERLHAWRFELLAVVLVALYFAAPANIRSTTLVYHRFLPPAWAILVVCAGAGARERIRLPARLLCGAVPLASLLIAWPSFADSHREYSDLDTLIDRIEVGSSVVVLNLGPDPNYRLWSPAVAGGHVVAVRGGRSMHDYTLSPVSPVTQRAAKQWAEPLDRFDGVPGNFCPDWDFTRFRYLLLVSTSPGLAYAVTLAVQADAKLTAHKGHWYLFESVLPRVAIDADDVPIPMPHPPLLKKRLKEVVTGLDQAERESGKTQFPQGWFDSPIKAYP